MPSNEEHAQHTYRLYGIWAYDLHEWMDAPSTWYGPNHRVYRHNVNKPPPFSAIKKYGYEMARKLQIAHLRLDGELWGTPPDLPIWQEGDWIYKQIPNGKVYKRNLHAEPTPRPRPHPRRVHPSGMPPEFYEGIKTLEEVFGSFSQVHGWLRCVYCGTQITQVFHTGQVLCPKCGQYRPPENSQLEAEVEVGTRTTVVRVGGNVSVSFSIGSDPDHILAKQEFHKKEREKAKREKERKRKWVDSEVK
jgi:hypothetical protein